MTLSTPEFTYQPLDESLEEIRLVRLSRPCRPLLSLLGRRHLDVAQGEICHFRLRSAPPFTALSYCWGSPTRTKSILINGGRLAITENLASYIKHRTSSRCNPAPSSYLWIDAVCINQADAVERSKQVVRMKQIYEQAESIHIWLGPCDEQIDFFLDRVNAAIRKSRNRRMSLPPNFDYDLLPFLESLPLHSWKGMAKMLANPWWTRAWIVQEASTPGNDVSVLCGHRCVSIDIVTYIFRYLTYAANARYLQNIPWEAVGMLFWTREGRGLKEDASDLCLRLEDTKTYHATDPRDKVYSVLALVNDAFDSTMQPDYTLPVEKVYTSVAQCILKQRRDLRLLYSCFNSDKLDGLPSWVPDWKKKQDEPIPFRYAYYKSYYCTSDCPLAVLDFKDYADNCCALLIEGSIVEEVSHVGVCRRVAASDGDCAKDWAQMAFGHNAGHRYLDSAASLEAFARTLCADLKDKGSSGGELQRGYSSKWPEPNANGKHPEDCFTMSLRRDATTLDRNFFLTSSGRMGLGQPPIRAGDKVCILSGAEMPFVLREFEKDKFSLVGPAYVDGIMDGEATKKEGFEESLRIFEIW